MKTTAENIMAALNRRNITEMNSDKFHLNLDNPTDKLIGDAICYGIQAVRCFRDAEVMESLGCIENIPGFVKLETMAEYSVVDLDAVFAAIQSSDNLPEIPMHDAY